MTPDTHLLDTKLFRIWVGGPLLLGLFLFSIAIAFSWDRLTLCFQTECFNTFFSLFKFQIGVMGLAIPFGALVASQHRSVQTKEQIDSQWKQISAQKEQNTFSNHLSHRNHFNEFFEEFKPFGDVNMFSKWELYDSLFPNAADGVFEANQKVIDLLDEIDDVRDRFRVAIDANELALEPGMKMRLIAFNAATESLLGISSKTLLEDDIDLPANEVQKHLLSMSTVVLGLHSCLNFHKTHITNSVAQNLVRKLNSLASTIETECRCERIADTLLKCLIRDTYDTKTTKEYMEIVEQSLNSELEKLARHLPEQRLDFSTCLTRHWLSRQENTL